MWIKNDLKRNLARHIGAAHGTIYKILKRKGHQIDILRSKDEKRKETKSTGVEVKHINENKILLKSNDKRPFSKAKSDQKITLKTSEKLQCTHCTRKYSNGFNLRKHILFTHDKIRGNK